MRFRPLTPAGRSARLFAALGAAVVIATALPNAGRTDLAGLLGLLLFTAWALVPYVVLGIAGAALNNPWVVRGAGASALAVEIGVRLAVFVFPRGSTAAIALLFSPAAIVIGAMPLGAAAGFVLSLVMRAAPAWVRGLSLALATGLLALITLGLARPDLWPTTVYARQRALERIGAPGVRMGGDRFEPVRLSDTRGWYLAGEFDGVPGDEVAVIDTTAAQVAVRIFDLPSLQARVPRPLSGDVARWNWFSQLAWSDGDLRRVDTGGGFQQTQVMSLDGTLRFRYHPDAQLPPNALRPADLDGDGDAEFYASTQRALVRLDAAGEERWRHPQNAPEIVAVLPASAAGPAWVVTQVYGQPATVWSPGGEVLATVAHAEPSERPLLGAFDWQGTRVLAYGGEQLTLRTTAGESRFSWRVDDMRIAGAWRVQFTPATPEVLVVLATADRDTHRARLQLVDGHGTLVYDEVCETMPRVLTARQADGATTLLVGTTGLHLLRPR